MPVVTKNPNSKCILQKYLETKIEPCLQWNEANLQKEDPVCVKDCLQIKMKLEEKYLERVLILFLRR